MCPYQPKHTKGNTNIKKIKHIYVTGVNRSGHTTLWNKIEEDPDINSAMMGEEQFMLPWDIEKHNHTEMLRNKFIDRVNQLIEWSPKCDTHLDMGNYWLPHTPWLIEKFDAQIHIIKRNKDDVIDGFMQKFEDHVDWDVVQKFITTDMNATNWEISYPTYERNPDISLQENYRIHTGKYYDEFYEIAAEFKRTYPANVHWHASEYLIEGDNYKNIFKF